MNAHDFLVEIEDGKAAIIYELESLVERCRDIYFNEATCEFSVENPESVKFCLCFFIRIQTLFFCRIFRRFLF